jgi:hypothetical protein
MPSDGTPDIALPGFQALAFDAAQCHRDLDDLEALLSARNTLRENADILPFFRAHPHLSLLLGSYNPNMITYDRLAYELSLFGQFRADIVVGDWTSKRYCFVEFEDAAPDSVFVAGRGEQTTEWAARFEHGYSQIIDWFWLLEASKNTELIERQFGQRAVPFSGLLVVGRNKGISVADRSRFEWRRDYVVVNSKQIFFCTFDELLRDMRRRLRSWAIPLP